MRADSWKGTCCDSRTLSYTEAYCVWCLLGHIHTHTHTLIHANINHNTLALASTNCACASHISVDRGFVSKVLTDFDKQYFLLQVDTHCSLQERPPLATLTAHKILGNKKEEAHKKFKDLLIM